jgi:hypothetical protein
LSGELSPILDVVIIERMPQKEEGATRGSWAMKSFVRKVHRAPSSLLCSGVDMM